MENELKRPDFERVIAAGDLAGLTPDQRVQYYAAICESLGLNPLTRPFQYLELSGKLVLYARKDCTDQLRKRDKVSLMIVARELVEDIYVVTARATTPDGRTDESIGAVPLVGLKGENRANAMMKSETKAKRRVTLSICGLGMLDETEVDLGAAATVLPAVLPANLPPAQQPKQLAPAPQPAPTGDAESSIDDEEVLDAIHATNKSWDECRNVLNQKLNLGLGEGSTVSSLTPEQRVRLMGWLALVRGEKEKRKAAKREAATQ